MTLQRRVNCRCLLQKWYGPSDLPVVTDWRELMQSESEHTSRNTEKGLENYNRLASFQISRLRRYRNENSKIQSQNEMKINLAVQSPPVITGSNKGQRHNRKPKQVEETVNGQTERTEDHHTKNESRSLYQIPKAWVSPFKFLNSHRQRHKLSISQDSNWRPPCQRSSIHRQQTEWSENKNQVLAQ